MDLLQDGAEFFVVGLVLRHDGGLQARSREVDRVELEILPAAQSVWLVSVSFSSERRADVAGNQLVDGVAVLPSMMKSWLRRSVWPVMGLYNSSPC